MDKASAQEAAKWALDRLKNEQALFDRLVRELGTVRVLTALLDHEDTSMVSANIAISEVGRQR